MFTFTVLLTVMLAEIFEYSICNTFKTREMHFYKLMYMTYLWDPSMILGKCLAYN